MIGYNKMIYVYSFILCFIYFYIRVNKKDMKGILYRKDSYNKLQFTPLNLLNLMIHPFSNYNYWYYNLLDINFPFIYTIVCTNSYILINLIKYM